ncbi:MAG: HAD hydrolase-like protein [Helicobacteraceae bacterium]|jgi:phosphoglycolate phosphatase|nr:HAD hydrolase-like protein [Helicobacteraceae bacterium]
MAKNAAVLFDLDGTLIDSAEAIVESFGAAFAHFGEAPPDMRAITKAIGRPLQAMFAAFGVSEAQIQSYVERYKERYREICLEKTSLLTGAKEALALLKPLTKIGVVTTKTTSFSKEILTHLGAAQYIDAIVGFEEVKNPKPHPEPILLALKRLRVSRRIIAGDLEKSEIFMVGDTPIDINAALNANVTPIGLLCGYAEKEDFAPFNCAVYENALEAAKAIAVVLA